MCHHSQEQTSLPLPHQPSTTFLSLNPPPLFPPLPPSSPLFPPSSPLQVTVFHFEDEVRPEAAAAVHGLQHASGMNMRVALLTGDHSASAQRVASSLGISDVSSELKPEDKLSMVQAWAERKGGPCTRSDEHQRCWAQSCTHAQQTGDHAST